jgi:hypothetical protein
MNGENENNSQDHGEIANLKYSYDKALDIFRLHNDNYFKRIQIIMVAIQAGLFFVIIKLLTPIPVLPKELIFPIIVTFIGIAIAYAWGVLMTRQMQYMMLIKNYIQNLEAKFVDLKLPIDYFNIEASISKKFSKDHFRTMTADIDDVEKLKEDGKHCNFAEFKWSKVKCPATDEKAEKIHKVGAVRGNMVKIESWLSTGTIILWIVLLGLLIFWITYCLRYSPCSC